MKDLDPVSGQQRARRAAWLKGEAQPAGETERGAVRFDGTNPSEARP